MPRRSRYHGGSQRCRAVQQIYLAVSNLQLAAVSILKIQDPGIRPCRAVGFGSHDNRHFRSEREGAVKIKAIVGLVNWVAGAE